MLLYLFRVSQICGYSLPLGFADAESPLLVKLDENPESSNYYLKHHASTSHSYIAKLLLYLLLASDNIY